MYGWRSLSILTDSSLLEHSEVEGAPVYGFRSRSMGWAFELVGEVRVV